LTVAIVTRPFLFEGKVRDRNARKGIDDLRKVVDTIIVIPNQKLLSIVDRKTSLIDAFKTADDVLYQATKGISDLISVHGLVNLDFADVKTIMKGMGDALMGTGAAEGENRAVIAADAAIHSPLLDDVSIAGARGILINITGGEDMTLYDVSDATQTVYEAVGEDSETNIIFGAVTDPAMNGKIRVTVIATGFNEETIEAHKAQAPKLSVKFPGAAKNVPEKIEQMSIALNVPSKNDIQERTPERVLERSQETVIVELPRVVPDNDDSPYGMRNNDDPMSSAMSNGNSSIEFPAFLKKTERKERTYVSRGSVMTQLEDDMDVPTFLRKQMQ